MSPYYWGILLLLLAGSLMLFIAYLSFRKRQLAAARYSGFAMLAPAVYAIGYAFELMSPTFEAKRIWLIIQYAGIPFIPVFWLLLVLHVTGYHNRLKPWLTPLLFVVPVLTLMLNYTTDFHPFFYHTIEPPPEPVSPLLLKQAFGFWVHVSYSYLIFISTIGVLLVSYIRSSGARRKQAAVLLAGGAVPILLNCLYVFGTDDGRFDYTPIGFALTGIAHIWGIYRIHLLQLVPIAIQQVYETMKDGIVIIDEEGRITDVNKAACQMFPPLEQTSETNASIRQALPDVPELLEVLEQEDGSELRIRILQPDEVYHYSVKISGLYDTSHTRIGRMLLISDISQMIRDQEELKELGAFKDRLFTTVAHDIRDPLAILMNLITLIEEDSETAWKGDTALIREVGDQVRQTYMLVDGLLDWYKSQAGKTVYTPTSWHLEAVVRQTVDALRHKSDKKQIAIVVALDADAVVTADKEMIGLVLRNLLSNSIKYTAAGGTVTVSATVGDSRIFVDVSDNGIGMDDDRLQSLFKAIQQQPEAGTWGEPGTGLGLFLSSKLIQMHGGEIICQSRPGEGSLFRFSLAAAAPSHLSAS